MICCIESTSLKGPKMKDTAKEAAITTLITTVLGSTLTAITNALLPAASQLDVPQCAASVAIGAAIGFLAGSSRAKKHERAAADEKMTELQAEHAAELQAERERLEAEIESAKASCAKRLAAAQAAYGQAVEELQADYDALTSKRAAKLDKLARTFACMPKASKELVAEALDKGELIVAADSSTRTNRAVTLAEKGILWFTQPIGERFPMYVREDVITEIREHRSEWLGM